MSNKLTVGRPIKGPPYRQFICKPPPPHRRTVRPGVGVRFFFKDSPRSERSRRSFQKEDTRGPKGFLKTFHIPYRTPTPSLITWCGGTVGGKGGGTPPPGDILCPHGQAGAPETSEGQAGFIYNKK